MNTALPPTKAIVWLHLSDLHLCKARKGWDMHRVLNPLIKDLQYMENTQGLQPDLVFFTGDAAYGELPESSLSVQYQEVEAFLTRVRNAFTQKILKKNVFLVPGNHDVNRDKVLESQTLWLDQEGTVAKITDLIQNGKNDWRQYMDRLESYREFLQNNGYTHLLKDPERLVYTQIREIQGIKIGIGGFNSAWSCGRDREKSKLWLGGNWQNGTIVDDLEQQVALKIALIHHPPGWFVDQEDNLISHAMKRDFTFFLHGHEHQKEINVIDNRHIRISAAASYEDAQGTNGYNFVRLNLQTGDVEIWLRKFDTHNHGWIPFAIANETDDHGLRRIKAFPPLVELTTPPLHRPSPMQPPIASYPTQPEPTSAVLFPGGILKMADKETAYTRFALQPRNVSVLEYREFLEQSNDKAVIKDLPFSEKAWKYRKMTLLATLTRLDDDMSSVSFYEALAYARWKNLRLPTITEMQVAASFLAKNSKILCDKVSITSSAPMLKTVALDYVNDHLWTGSAYPETTGAMYLFGGQSKLCNAILSPGGQNKSIGLVSNKIRCAIINIGV